MKPSKNRLLFVSGVLLLASTAPIVLAEAKPNPYQAIIERNPFGLKPPPPPVDNTPPPAVIPLAKVVLTGITSVFGPTRALLEVTEQEPGKTVTTRRPIMREGDQEGAIEVVSIDVEKSLVKIRNAGHETNLSFETPKLAAGPAAAPAVPGFPPPPLNTGLVPPPHPFGANGLPTPSGRGSGVTILGGGPVPTPAAPPGVAPAGAPTPGAYPTPGTYPPNGAMTRIPTRSLRTDTAK